MLCILDQCCDVFERVSDEGPDVESHKGFGISPVVFDETPAARGPDEGSFDGPASGQQNKPALYLRQFDDVQRDAFG